jgi:hypothetical protein
MVILLEGVAGFLGAGFACFCVGGGYDAVFGGYGGFGVEA